MNQTQAVFKSFWLNHSSRALTQKLSKALQHAVKYVPLEDTLATNYALVHVQKQVDKVTFYTTRRRQKKSHFGHFSTNAYPNYVQIEHDPVALPTRLNQCLWQPEENFDKGTK